MTSVSHLQARQLLHNKFVVVLGDSIQRSVYKDLVLLLQKDRFLTNSQLKCKGEESFEKDCLVEGGTLNRMHNGTGYKEVRQFKSDHHLVRFYFVTRVYSPYMESILEDFRTGLKPDVIIFNSCVWDISRYNSSWLDNYRENLNSLFTGLKESVPQETLTIWNLTMPLGENIRGGFLVPESKRPYYGESGIMIDEVICSQKNAAGEFYDLNTLVPVEFKLLTKIEHRVPHLRYDVIEANFFSGTLAVAHGMDVLDLHFQFRFSLQHRTRDGVHWNALAHRKITALLLEHSAQAWGVILQTVLDHTQDAAQLPAKENYKSSEIDSRLPGKRQKKAKRQTARRCYAPYTQTNHGKQGH